MNIKILTLGVVFLTICLPAFSESYAPEDKVPVSIKDVSIFDDIARVRLNSMPAGRVVRINTGT